MCMYVVPTFVQRRNCVRQICARDSICDCGDVEPNTSKRKNQRTAAVWSLVLVEVVKVVVVVDDNDVF